MAIAIDSYLQEENYVHYLNETLDETKAEKPNIEALKPPKAEGGGTKVEWFSNLGLFNLGEISFVMRR